MLEGVHRGHVGTVDLRHLDGSAWNDFLWPLIAVNKPEMFPLPVALALLRSAYSSESYGPIMAGTTLSAFPLLIVFLVANRRIVEGVRLSGLKG